MSETIALFPNNLFTDLNVQAPKEQPQDFYPTLMYVLHRITSDRNVELVLARYREGLTYETVGAKYGLTKQRVQAIVQDMVDRMHGKYTEMLVKGLKKYTDDLLIDRVENLTPMIVGAEREELVHETYTEAYNLGFKDGSGQNVVSMNTKPLELVNVNTLDLSARTFNALARNHLYTLGDVMKKGDEIMYMPTFGKTCFHEIANILYSHGVRVLRAFPRATKKFDWSEPNE